MYEFVMNVFCSGEFVGDQHVQTFIAEAERKINEAITGNIAKLINSNSPADLRKILRFPSEEALTIAKATEFLEAFVQLIQDKAVFNLTESEVSVVNLVSPHQLQVCGILFTCFNQPALVSSASVHLLDQPSVILLVHLSD